VVLCAAGYNLRWLMRAVARLGLKGFLLRLNISAWWKVLNAWLSQFTQQHRLNYQ